MQKNFYFYWNVFEFFLKICLVFNRAELEKTERLWYSICCFTVRRPHPGARSFIQVSHVAILCCISRHSSRELDLKWSNLDCNQVLSRNVLVSQTAAQPTEPQGHSLATSFNNIEWKCQAFVNYLPLIKRIFVFML